MANINDRIGSQNVIRVLSNASAPPSNLIDLNDVNEQFRDEDGLLLIWDEPSDTFIMTSVVDRSLTVTGVVIFSDNTNSTLPTNGALVVSGGVGVGGNINVENELNVKGATKLATNGGITTTTGNLFVGQNFEVAGTSNFIGTATFRGGTIGIGDSHTDDINVQGEFISNLVPNEDNTYDLGTSAKRWRNLRISGLTTTSNLYVTGVSTFTSRVNVSGFITVTDGIYYEIGDYDGPNGIAYFDNTGKLTGAGSTEVGITTSNYILTTNSVGIPTWTSVIDGGSY